MAHTRLGRSSPSARGKRAGRGRGGKGEDTNTRRPRAATKRSKSVLVAALPVASLGHGNNSGSSKKQARQIGAPPAAPAVSVKAEGAGRPDGEGQGPSRRSMHPRWTGGIQFRPTPPMRGQVAGGDPTAVRTEASANLYGGITDAKGEMKPTGYASKHYCALNSSLMRQSTCLPYEKNPQLTKRGVSR